MFGFKLYYINCTDYSYSSLVWRDKDKPWKFWVTTENLWTQIQNQTLLSMKYKDESLHCYVQWNGNYGRGNCHALLCNSILASAWETADNVDKNLISESNEYAVSINHKTRHHRFLMWPHTAFLIPKFAVANSLPLLKQTVLAPSVIQCLLLCTCCRVCITWLPVSTFNTLPPWRWRQHIPLRHQWIFIILHSITSQKPVFLILLSKHPWEAWEILH